MVAEATADRFVGIARDAIEARGVFRVALSGGGDAEARLSAARSTARACAPSTGARSSSSGATSGRCRRTTRSRTSASPTRCSSPSSPGCATIGIHRMAAESSDLDGSALTYESEIRLAFDARGEAPPAFDLIWLGMGAGRPHRLPLPRQLRPRRARPMGGRQLRTVAARVADDDDLPPARRRPRGALRGHRRDKATALAAIRAGRRDLPAARVAAHRIHWLVDRAAAGRGHERARGGGPVSPLLWLALATRRGLGAWWIGWPAWPAYRARDRRDANVDRYLAWRGRADRRPSVARSRGSHPRRAAALGHRAVLGSWRSVPWSRSSSPPDVRVELLFRDGDPRLMEVRQRLVEVLTEDAFETRSSCRARRRGRRAAPRRPRLADDPDRWRRYRASRDRRRSPIAASRATTTPPGRATRRFPGRDLIRRAVERARGWSHGRRPPSAGD